MAADDADTRDHKDDASEAHDRLLMPLLVPALAFLFTLLVVYGLSRIYLELDTYNIDEVSMATPLAIGVSMAILGVCAWLAMARRITLVQVVLVVGLAASLLTVGGVWAAVHDEGGEEHAVVNGETPPPEDGTPVAEGTVLVNLHDDPWAVEANPASAAAGEIVFNLNNTGTIVHNLRVARTDLDDDQLPVDSAAFAVDEDGLDIAVSSPDVDAGGTLEVTETLDSGGYVLFCNIAQHYENGMHTAFTVE